MNYDAMSMTELEQHSAKLKADIEALRETRRQCARALEAKVSREQARRDLARLGPERVDAMSQEIQAMGIASREQPGTPGAQP